MIWHGHHGNCIKIALQMSDEDIVHRAARLFNTKVYGPHGPYGISKKQTWQTICFGVRAAQFLMTLYPLFGIRRQNKVRELIEYWKTQNMSPMKGRKALCHLDRPHYTKGRCKPCARHERYVTKGD